MIVAMLTVWSALAGAGIEPHMSDVASIDDAMSVEQSVLDGVVSGTSSVDPRSLNAEALEGEDGDEFSAPEATYTREDQTSTSPTEVPPTRFSCTFEPPRSTPLRT